MWDIAFVLGSKLEQETSKRLSKYLIYDEITIVDAGKIAIDLVKKGVKSIVTTGGTIDEIRKHVDIPIVSANHTYFDLLETLFRLEKVRGIKKKRVALLLHVSNDACIERIGPFISNQVRIFKYKNQNDIGSIVETILAIDAYDIIVGGPTTISYAQRYGMDSMQLLLGEESIFMALGKARLIIDAMRKERRQSQLVQAVIDLSSDGIMAVDTSGHVLICNPLAARIFHRETEQIIDKNVEQVTMDLSWEEVYQRGMVHHDIVREYHGKKFFVTRRPIIDHGKIIGAVGSLQAVARIEKLEHKFRNYQTMGLTAKYHFCDIIGGSDVIKKTIEQAKAYAGTNSTILIEGETGTGKEMFAQSIHNHSNRKNGPFVAINCAALPETLLESELMGYEEGAFTGARRGGKAGLFELAHQGTIFLDEVNQIPVAIQARVLRVIQEKVVMRLGGNRVIPVDVHIIAATNEHLLEAIAADKFRDDLYYRLNVLNLKLPPLRQRVTDVELLLGYFLDKYTGNSNQPAAMVSETLSELRRYHWPGNIRELANFVERYVVLNAKHQGNERETIRSFIAGNQLAVQAEIPEKHLCIAVDTLKNMERKIAAAIVQRCNGSKQEAALVLGISRTTLWSKLKST